jgi:monofunctional biosynthetic peptidoglycan transglycosylase
MWFFIVSIASVLLFRWSPIPITPLMAIRCVQQKIAGKSMKLKKDWVSFAHLPSDLKLAVVCSEDQNFLKHRGFDYEAIERALNYNDSHTRKRGASTISQQTAKNVFLWPGRSWVRKGFEVYFTFLIETIWSKKRILEVYLNVIEMGDGVYGAEAASHEYFHKNAIQMTKTEAATLAAVLPNPIRFHAAHPDGFVLSRRSWILNQMMLWGGVLDFHSAVVEKK